MGVGIAGGAVGDGKAAVGEGAASRTQGRSWQLAERRVDQDRTTAHATPTREGKSAAIQDQSAERGALVLGFTSCSTQDAWRALSDCGVALLEHPHYLDVGACSSTQAPNRVPGDTLSPLCVLFASVHPRTARRSSLIHSRPCAQQAVRSAGLLPGSRTARVQRGFSNMIRGVRRGEGIAQ